MGEVMWHTPGNPNAAHATAQEATNVSIDTVCHTSSTQHMERLTPNLPPSATTTPLAGAVLTPLHGTEEKSADKTGGIFEPNSMKKATLVASTMSLNDASVEALTSPVMSLSIDDGTTEKSLDESDSHTPEPLSPDSLEKARSAAEAVAAFLQYPPDPYPEMPAGMTQANSEQPTMRRGRYQRRNSFVIHRKRSRSLHEGREGAVAMLMPRPAARDGDASVGPTSGGKPKFDLSTARSQSDGTLMSPTTPPSSGTESGVNLHRLSLPWKRKKRDSSTQL